MTIFLTWFRGLCAPLSAVDLPSALRGSHRTPAQAGQMLDSSSDRHWLVNLSINLLSSNCMYRALLVIYQSNAWRSRSCHGLTSIRTKKHHVRMSKPRIESSRSCRCDYQTSRLFLPKTLRSIPLERAQVE